MANCVDSMQKAIKELEAVCYKHHSGGYLFKPSELDPHGKTKQAVKADRRFRMCMKDVENAQKALKRRDYDAALESIIDGFTSGD